ncbi:MAG: acyl-CoA dehydrogenase family protein, partial [Cetobacterium sp.]
MDFKLTKSQELFKQMITEFVENEVRPLAAEVDEEERFPVETVEKMSKIGLMGVTIPKEYGGAGGDQIMYTMAVEELSKACGTTGVILSAHASLGVAPILELGNEEQKRRFLPKMATGEWIGAFGLTEANAGTDASGQQTSAYFDEATQEWVINGSKIFITNAGYAHVYVIFAMTDKSKGIKGISSFIIEADTPGFSIGKKEKKLGIKGSATCELIFENCRIPKENLLGALGKGFGIAMKTLDGGRIGIAAQALGIAGGALDETIKYVGERKQFGKTLSKFQNTQFQIADMYARVEAAKNLVYKAAWKKSTKQP